MSLDRPENTTAVKPALQVQVHSAAAIPILQKPHMST